MNDIAHKGLLPTGLADILPPEAEFEAEITEMLMASFSQYGYERVKPPLIEFEDILLSGSGTKTAKQTFRMMDPISQRMLGIRADMTLQIARIASTRLCDVQRPLRLSYAGQVLRVKGSDLRPKRQFAQIGTELIGSHSPRADAEVILMAAEALSNVGVANLSIDLGLPTLVPITCEKLGIDLSAKDNKIRIALNQKDGPGVGLLAKELGNEAGTILNALLESVGPVDKALEKFQGINLPKEAAAEIQNLSDIIFCLKKSAPDLKLTVDPVETRGYEYHTGTTFTFFALNVRGEIGRGGRYLVNDADGIRAPETATGVSLFIDTILRALPKPQKKNRVLVPSSKPEVVFKLRKEGWIVVEHFEENNLNANFKADKFGCSHYWNGNQIVPATLL